VQHRQTKNQTQRDQKQTARDVDLQLPVQEGTLAAVCDRIATLGGKHFGGRTWRRRLFEVAAHDMLPELLQCADKVEAALAGRGEHIDNPGGFIGAAILRLGKGNPKC
jgi:hypothetical protein